MSELAIKEGEEVSIFGLSPSELSRIDTDALKSLLEMKEQMEDRGAEKAFNASLAKAQAEMPTVTKWREETRGKYRYAAFDDVWRVARPVLEKHGFAVSFAQSETDAALTVTCVASHVGGHTRETPFTLPKDGPLKTKDGRNIQSQAQAQGSANSYAKRYCFCNAFNIVVSDEDDDGISCAVEVVTEDDATAMLELLDQVDADTRKRCLEWLGVESADQCPKAKYQRAMKLLQDKLA